MVRGELNSKSDANSSKGSIASKASIGTVCATAFTQSELAVFRVFRRFLMTPGRMLCFTPAEQATLGKALTSLTRQTLLNAEQFPGSYSLTRAGFLAMRSTN